MTRALVVLALLSGVAHADIELDPCACSPNKPGFHRADNLTGDWGGLRKRLFEHGVMVHATYAGELFTSPSLDGDRVVGAGLAALTLDADLDVIAFHVSAFGIHGHGLSEQLMDVYGVSNNVAPPGVRLFEAWIDKPIGPFSIRAGLLAADQEFVLADHSVVLLNATFGILAMVSYNVGNPVYPVAVPGARASFESDVVSVRAALYDGDHYDEHGIPHEVGGDAFVIGELQLSDLIKLGAWHHTSAGNGYYGIVDHQLERHVGAFARVSVSPDKPVSLYMDTGIRIGPGPFRRKDFISVGLAFARTELGAQTVVEGTYQYLVRGWLTVQPDAQVVLTRTGTAGVLAMRGVMAF